MDNQDLIAERKKEANKVAIFFIIKMFFFYFLFQEGNKFMYSSTTPTGRFYKPFFADHLNYIQGLRDALIIPSTWIVKAFGFTTYRNATEYMIVDGPILSINYDCLGLNVMSFLVAFAIAFPAPLKQKGKLLAITVLTVYVLNILRIAGLGLLLKFFPSQQVNFEYHHEAFSIIIYIVIFFMLYRWIKKHTSFKLKPSE